HLQTRRVGPRPPSGGPRPWLRHPYAPAPAERRALRGRDRTRVRPERAEAWAAWTSAKPLSSAGRVVSRCGTAIRICFQAKGSRADVDILLYRTTRRDSGSTRPVD